MCSEHHLHVNLGFRCCTQNIAFILYLKFETHDVIYIKILDSHHFEHQRSLYTTKTIQGLPQSPNYYCKLLENTETR